MTLVLFSRGQISRCKIAHLIRDSGQDHPSAGNGELCIIRHGNVNASIVSNALLSLFRRRLTKRSGWGRGRRGRGDGQTDPRVNILIQMPTDFFYDRDISQLPHWERVRGRGETGKGRLHWQRAHGSDKTTGEITRPADRYEWGQEP